MKPAVQASLKDSMSDQAIQIKATGLSPNQTYTFHSYATVDNGNTFECVAQYISDSRGSICLQNDKSVAGSFHGCEPMGLFWALKPSLKNKKSYARMIKVNVTTPLVFTLKLYNSTIPSVIKLDILRKEGILSKMEVASLDINRWFMKSGTKRITFTMDKDCIHGTLFIPDGDGPFPGVIVLFGGYPGTLEFKASLLASHGFAALALAFYGVPGLRESLDETANHNIDLEYFEKAIHVMSRYSQVNTKVGVGIIGISLSTPIVLALCECVKLIKCVVAINGYVNPIFTTLSYKGKRYAVEPYDFGVFSNLNRSDVFSYRYYYPKYRSIYSPNPESVIKFYDRHDVALMFIAGLDDENTPSEYAINIAARLLKKAKHPNYQLLRYPGAGHLIEPPYAPHNYKSFQKGFLQPMVNWGGSMFPHCKAQEDSWHRQIEFLKSSLLLDSKL